jgi:phosphoglycolate phosphatase-like HAD superfamily hydrolase
MKKTPTLIDLYEAIKPKYTIFCDMDGVLVDFDKGYEDLTGMSTSHANEQGRDEFWGLLTRSLKEKGLTEYDYWVNLPWMPDGQTLWDYIKQYKPYILTAPSLDPGSKQGKREWVQRLDGMKNIYFKPARFKQELSGKNRILIDDRKDTIDRWNAAGGIGIFHTSTEDTIKQLQNLGL